MPLTSTFMHSGLLHLAASVLALSIFGPRLERRVESARFLGVFLVAGLASSAVLIALTPDLPIAMIGATGGVAGVVGAHAVSWPRSRLTPLELPALRLAATWVLTQVAAAGADASQPVAGAGGDIAYLASLAGLMVGTVLAVTAFTSPAADAALTTLPSSTAPRSRT